MKLIVNEYYTGTDKSHIDGILYQAMVDETMRLRKSRSSKERSEIRGFIIEAYQLLTESNQRCGHQGTTQQDMLQPQ